MILNVFKGILIGAGAILPGISSGVLCVIMGIYEKLLDSVLNFFKDIKNNVKYLFPIVLGGIIGIIFIIMEPCFFTSKIENRNQLHQKQHTKDQIPVSFLHIPSCPQTQIYVLQFYHTLFFDKHFFL